MLLGRVIGQVVPCIATPGLEGVPMLIVQPLDKKLAPKGKAIVAADSTRMAGPGELVSYEGGREAALALERTFVPVDHAIIAIVDGVNVAGHPERSEGSRPMQSASSDEILRRAAPAQDDKP